MADDTNAVGGPRGPRHPAMGGCGGFGGFGSGIQGLRSWPGLQSGSRLQSSQKQGRGQGVDPHHPAGPPGQGCL